MKHGLLADAYILPGEDDALFRRLVEEFVEELEPVGALEALIVDRIAVCWWRLRRAANVETGLFVRDVFEDVLDRARADLADHLGPEYDPKTKANKLVTHTRELIAEEVRAGSANLLGGAFARDADDANAFTKLSRYETALERSLFRSMNELKKTQQERRQRAVSRISLLRQTHGQE